MPMKQNSERNRVRNVLRSRTLIVMALTCFVCHFSFTRAEAQIFVGFLSYDSALVSMPQYAAVEKQMATLRQAYQDELQRVEADFNQKYEAFLEGRKDFPRTILLKRQTELQQLLQRNLEFKEQGLRDLERTRQEALAPLHQHVAEAVAAVARRYRLAVVVNTDSNACPYIDPEVGLDISNEVKQQLTR